MAFPASLRSANWAKCRKSLSLVMGGVLWSMQQFQNQYHYDIAVSSILVRDVPPETLRALKRLARSHHRSLQGELHAILDRVARMAPPETEGPRLKLVTVRVGQATAWNRDEIYGADGR